MVIHWNPDPEIFHIGSFSLRYYSLLFVSGLIIGYQVVKSFYLQEGRKQEEIDRLALYIFIATIVGARLGHCLFYEPSYYLSRPLEMLLPIQMEEGSIRFVGYQGLASHGGILAVFIAIYIYGRKYKLNFFDLLDKVAVGGAVAGAFIRLGNFMNSEIIGKPTSGDFGVIFARVDDIPRHPAQLYESIAYFIIFFVLWWLFRKKRAHFQPGFIFGLFFALLFLTRFLIEFLKENQVSFEDGMALNMGQWLSIPFFILGIYVMWIKQKMKARSEGSNMNS